MTKAEIKSLIARLTHENTTEKEEAEILNAIVDAMQQEEMIVVGLTEGEFSYDEASDEYAISEEGKNRIWTKLFGHPFPAIDGDIYANLRRDFYVLNGKLVKLDLGDYGDSLLSERLFFLSYHLDPVNDSGSVSFVSVDSNYRISLFDA